MRAGGTGGSEQSIKLMPIERWLLVIGNQEVLRELNRYFTLQSLPLHLTTIVKLVGAKLFPYHEMFLTANTLAFTLHIWKTMLEKPYAEQLKKERCMHSESRLAADSNIKAVV